MSELSVRDLAVSRGDRILFSGLTFSVAGGELLHLQGANGAGKTSLLETLSGLRAPAAGTIARPASSAMHWLGHRSGLNAGLSALENLCHWCALNGARADAEAVTAALRRMELGAQRQRPCGSLSTGQRRRAALARLVAVRRPWWFLDEPLAGIDSAGLDLLGALLSEHLAEGGAAIVSSHQPLPLAPDRVRPLRLGA